MSARSSGGDSTSAWSSRSTTHERNAARFTTGRPTTTPPSGRRSTHRLLAELVDHPAGARRVDQDVGVDGLVLAVGHGVGAHEVGRVDAVGGRERRRRARARRSPSIRSTRNARGASRSRSWPTTYQCPNRSTTP